MWRTQAQAGAVYWLESYHSRRGTPRLTLSAAPVDIGPAMREQLFDKVPTVIMTSATLSVGALAQQAKCGFDFFKSRVGLTQCDAIQVGSPFNYREQAELVTLRDMPDPAQPSASAYEKTLHRRDPALRRPHRRPHVRALHQLRHAPPRGRRRCSRGSPRATCGC